MDANPRSPPAAGRLVQWRLLKHGV